MPQQVTTFEADLRGGFLFELGVVLVLILLNGVFAGAELAVLSVRKTRLSAMLEEGRRGARSIDFLRRNPERFLATVQVGITVVAAAAAAIGGATLAARFEGWLRSLGVGSAAGPASFVVVVGGISFVSLVLGELVPKSLALRYSEKYALRISRPLRTLAWVLRPVIKILTWTSNLFLRIFGDQTSFTESRLSADELKELMEEAARTGTVDKRSGEIAQRAFSLAELTAAEVMVPRSNIESIPRDISREALLGELLGGGHSRLPVYSGERTHIVGYALAADLVGVGVGKRRLSDVLRPAYFVPATMPAMTLLQQLQLRRAPIAFVVDELGGLLGLVTMEDLVEELVGEIFHEKEDANGGVHRRDDGTAVVDGATTIRDVNRMLNLSLPEDDGVTTVGGLCCALAGGIPSRHSKVFTEEGVGLEVVEATPRRVARVRIVPARRHEHAPAELH